MLVCCVSSKRNIFFSAAEHFLVLVKISCVLCDSILIHHGSTRFVVALSFHLLSIKTIFGDLLGWI